MSRTLPSQLVPPQSVFTNHSVHRGGQMSPSGLYMSMSLDSYIAGPNDEPSNVGGDCFARLHERGYTPDGESVRTTGRGGQLMDEDLATGPDVAVTRTA